MSFDVYDCFGVNQCPADFYLSVVRATTCESGHVSFAIVPYDMETNQALSEQGYFKGKSGTIIPHESDPNKSAEGIPGFLE